MTWIRRFAAAPIARVPLSYQEPSLSCARRRLASIALTYDDNGDLTADGIFQFVYDAWNGLVKVTRSIDAETTVATYAFDGLHRRTKKVVSNTGIETVFGDGVDTSWARGLSVRSSC